MVNSFYWQDVSRQLFIGRGNGSWAWVQTHAACARAALCINLICCDTTRAVFRLTMLLATGSRHLYGLLRTPCLLP
jgi:hypothetical protein